MLLRVESFDHFVTADAPKKGWTLSGASVSVSAGNGRNSTASLRGTNPFSGAALLSVSNTGRTGIVGFAFRCGALPSADIPLVIVREGATTHALLVLLTTGAVRVCRNTAATILGTSGTTPITGATWHFIEWAWNIHDSTGSYEVKVNGASVLTGSSADTQNAGTGIWTGVQWWSTANNAITHDVDDIYVADDNTFRGDHRIVCLLPSTGNGMHTAWTPSTGTDHGALVDDAAPNTTDYVSTNTALAIDTYNFPALGVAGTVAAVQASYYAKADVAGVRQLAHTAQIGGTNYPATAQSLAGDWQYQLYLSTTNPATAAAWTVSDIDAAEFGPKVAV